IRRQTLKSSERFITDELKTVETEYLSAQSLAITREKQLYHQLLTMLSSHLTELQQLSAAIAQIDVTSNWAQLATTYNWQRPVMSNDSKDGNLPKNGSQTSIDIKAGRHVVVEAALNPIHTSNNIHQSSTRHSSHFVANDCALGSHTNPERLLMITG